jgi:hypothetical protein
MEDVSNRRALYWIADEIGKLRKQDLAAAKFRLERDKWIAKQREKKSSPEASASEPNPSLSTTASAPAPSPSARPHSQPSESATAQAPTVIVLPFPSSSSTEADNTGSDATAATPQPTNSHPVNAAISDPFPTAAPGLNPDSHRQVSTLIQPDSL